MNRAQSAAGGTARAAIRRTQGASPQFPGVLVGPWTPPRSQVPGGLAHLDSQARHKYIRDKQKERELGSAMMDDGNSNR
jgi:hypothetical protein